MWIHLSHIGIFVYQLSDGNADAGSVKRMVHVISHAIAGIKKRPRFFNQNIWCNDNGFFLFETTRFLMRNFLWNKKKRPQTRSLF